SDGPGAPARRDREVRRRPRRRREPGDRGQRGARHRDRRRRAVPDPGRLPRAHPARPHRHAEGVRAPRPQGPAPRARPSVILAAALMLASAVPSRAGTVQVAIVRQASSVAITPEGAVLIAQPGSKTKPLEWKGQLTLSPRS